MNINLTPARNVLRERQLKLLKKANVTATGIGFKVTRGQTTKTLSIVCSVVEKLPEAQLLNQDLIPKTIEGIPTDVVVTGQIRAFVERTTRQRPAPGGISIGHYAITAGTLGCLVKKNGSVYILSNNHVLANSNEANIGDAILQPGAYDGGKMPADHIANLAEFVPVSFIGSPSTCPVGGGVGNFLNIIAKLLGSKTRFQAITIRALDNLVDAAIAKPLNERDLSEEILEIGKIKGLSKAELATKVKKSGRTTGLTTGEILQVDVTVNVQYGAGKIAMFSDQLMAGGMSQGGDSGSAVLDNNNNLVGLLFAGSDNSTIINRIQNVFSLLELSL